MWLVWKMHGSGILLELELGYLPLSSRVGALGDWGRLSGIDAVHSKVRTLYYYAFAQPALTAWRPCFDIARNHTHIRENNAAEVVDRCPGWWQAWDQRFCVGPKFSFVILHVVGFPPSHHAYGVGLWNRRLDRYPPLLLDSLHHAWDHDEREINFLLRNCECCHSTRW